MRSRRFSRRRCGPRPGQADSRRRLRHRDRRDQPGASAAVADAPLRRRPRDRPRARRARRHARHQRARRLCGRGRRAGCRLPPTRSTRRTASRCCSTSATCRGALGEIARVTRPGGRVLIVEPDNAARYWFSSVAERDGGVRAEPALLRRAASRCAASRQPRPSARWCRACSLPPASSRCRFVCSRCRWRTSACRRRRSGSRAAPPCAASSPRRPTKRFAGSARTS